MTEKYKIYISEDTRSRLVNDAELFEFTRSDQSVNLNAFLKELIVNYFDQYRRDTDELLGNIVSDLTSVKALKPGDAAALADKILKTYIRNTDTAGGKSTVITLTVSGPSYNILRIIENNLLKDTSLSGYIKDMFISYLSIPRNKREEIIFKDKFDAINEAISEKRLLTFTSANLRHKETVEPYMIATSKEEQFNYLLCHDPRSRKNRTFRISRLNDVFITSKTFEIDEDIRHELSEKAMRSPHSMTTDIHAVIKMTESGKQKFKVVTKNRPDITKIEGDLYHFDWPEMQLDEYFRRFGKDAVVISPGSLRSRLRNYYAQALTAYVGGTK